VEALARHLSPQEKGSSLAESARRGLRQREMLASLAYRRESSQG